ncbi:MAG: metalloregulator ArsR/SmtB family transcription factor [Thermoanaerobaculia bacterium]
MKTLYHPDREAIELPAVLYALSDPVRLEIARRLWNQKELSCGAFELPVAKSTASHHFKVLREAGVIRVRQEGTSRFVSLRRDDLDALFEGLLPSILRSLGTKKKEL